MNEYKNLRMTESIPKKPLKKGSLVYVDSKVYQESIEALASDKDLPDYVFEGPGEILVSKSMRKSGGVALFQMFGLNSINLRI